MPDSLCKEKDNKKLARRAHNPQFVCKKCGRVAHKKKWLCKPIQIDS